MGKRESFLVSNRDLPAGLRWGAGGAHQCLLGRNVEIKVLASAFDRDGGFRRAVPPRARAVAHLS
jgi:hypothetical protein